MKRQCARPVICPTVNWNYQQPKHHTQRGYRSRFTHEISLPFAARPTLRQKPKSNYSPQKPLAIVRSRSSKKLLAMTAAAANSWVIQPASQTVVDQSDDCRSDAPWLCLS
jgi:hypothetical protein